MKYLNPILFFVLFPFLATVAQPEIPAWCDKSYRESHYPADQYLTGYMEGGKIVNETLDQARERMKKLAQSELIEGVMVQIQSYTESKVQDITQQSTSSVVQFYEASVKTESNMELTGLTNEVFYNPETATVHAFSYANRYEIIGYYKANIGFYQQQIIQVVELSDRLYTDGEKVKARSELEKAIPLFARIDYSYGVLLALKGNIDSLQYANSMQMKSTAIRKLADLEKGVIVFVQSSEDIFGSPSEILANALKRDLKGCSFTADESASDWKVTIDAKAREYSYTNGFYFSYADVVLSLMKTRTGQLVYQEEFSQKGGGSDYRKAARKAMEEAATVVSGKIGAEINK
ncbi:MAG: hypothetical protein KBC43_13340 [Bacteroidales bacterium]|nr:hypothetical protein [Bacteroidales bacterium]